MSIRHIILVAACGITAEAAIGQTCSPYWARAGFVIPSQAGNIAAFDDVSGPAIYASGNLALGSGPASHRVARWNGLAWESATTGLPSFVNIIDLLVLNDGAGPGLYVLGADSTPANVFWVSRRSGNSWVPGPPGMLPPDASAYPVLSLDDGSGTAIYGIAKCQPIEPGCYSRVVRWNGTSWVSFAGSSNDDIINLAAHDDGTGMRLYALGGFTQIGGVAANRIAKWNGVTWEPLGQGLDLPMDIRAMCSFDGSLYVGGYLESASGVMVHDIARWDGHNWFDPGGGVRSTSGFEPAIMAMHVFDDGRGPALYAAGFLSIAGGLPARGIARWDGESWSPLGEGIGAVVDDFAVMNSIRGPSLFAAGEFQTVGGGTSYGVAQWVGCPNCYANCDLSTRAPALNVNDFVCFLNRFAAKDPSANCTVDNVIDVNDFTCFLSKFAAGCP